MLVMVLADVAFVSAEIVYYDKKTDYSNCCKEEKYFIPRGPGRVSVWEFCGHKIGELAWARLILSEVILAIKILHGRVLRIF